VVLWRITGKILIKVSSNILTVFQYQVDHHLFPSLPRHNLRKAHELVRSFCKEWNVNYHEADLVDGTIEVLHHLNNVSNEFLLDFVVDGPTM